MSNATAPVTIVPLTTDELVAVRAALALASEELRDALARLGPNGGPGPADRLEAALEALATTDADLVRALDRGRDAPSG